MKTKLTLLTLFTTLFFASAQAQINVNVNVNTLPDWAPIEYVPETRYYYIPELEVYYDIPSKMYIYRHKNGWVRNKKLPKHYHKHNLNKCYKVSLYDIGPNPYAQYNSHKVKYPKNYNKGKRQATRSDNGKHKGHYKQNNHNNSNRGGNQQHKSQNNKNGNVNVFDKNDRGPKREAQNGSVNVFNRNDNSAKNDGVRVFNR